MTRYIAFLRAINVGGHVVKMDRLRALFEDLGLSAVETFIASGNVVFETKAKSERALEEKIARHLRESLGYDVGTFLRSAGELAAIARHPPVAAAELEAPGRTLYVAFLPGPASAEAQGRLLAVPTEIEEFRFHGREIYWLLRERLTESRFSGPLLEKTIGMPATVRNVNTVRKIAAKYCAP